MRSLPAALSTELANDAHAGLARLVEIGLASGTLYRTDWSADISFQPDGDDEAHTYVADEVEFGEIRASGVQENPTFRLRLQNRTHPTTGADRPWSTILAASNVTTASVAVRLVMVSNLAGTVQLAHEGWTLNQPRLADDSVEFTVGPTHHIYRLDTPWPRLKAPRCVFEYADGDCRSESTFATCPGKTLAECLQRHDPSKLRISQIPFNPQRLTRVS